MPKTAVFLATRNASIPSACRVFALTLPSTAVTSQQVRSHLLNRWPLYVRVFLDEDTANLWATGVVDGASSGRLPALSPGWPSSSSSPPRRPEDTQSPCTLSRCSFGGVESIVDLSNPQSSKDFFLSLGSATSAGGVRVQGLLESEGALNGHPSPISSLGKRRRLAEATGQAAAPQDVAAGTEGVAGPVAGGRERRRVAWAYQGGSRGRNGTVASRAERLSVAVRPTVATLPAQVSGDLLRVCRLLVAGTNVVLTGPPGCGKTHMINNAVQLMRDKGLVVSACASTGVAATLVGGTTVHSWAGFCNGDADVLSPLETVLTTVIPFAAKARMCASMVLVIDEVGTLSAAFLTRLDEVLRAVRRWPSPFGGLTVLAAGDFLQLAPPRGSYAFLSDTWRDAFAYRAVILKTHWRHVKDAELLHLLLRLRQGQHTAADMALLATRRTGVAPRGVICLFCHSADAHAKNEEELLQLAGESVVFKAVDMVHARYLTEAQASTLLNSASKLLQTLTLRVGAAVAVPTGCLTGQGVPCGSRGFVVCFRTVGNRRYPRVRFEVPSGRCITIDVIPAVEHTVALDGTSRAASRTQVPLVLAWASTIHAAQGWTLQEAAVDLTSAFAAGQALSGLSRTPTLDRLHIIGFDEDRIFVDGMALAFHESLVDL